LRENAALGPSANFSVARALPFLGSERDYTYLSGGLAWSFDWLDGYQSAGLGWSGRFERGALVDQSYSASLTLASPVVARLVRFVFSGAASSLVNDTSNSNNFLGGNTGLRGYEVGDLVGKTYFLAQVEARSMAIAIRALRLGAVAFCDMGDAATPNAGSGSGLVRALRSVGRLSPKSDVGVGARLLIPQFNSSVIRFDWAFATEATVHTRAGWPGRLSIGFRQSF
jgi:outer membrane protein assembly factor BamA